MERKNRVRSRCSGTKIIYVIDAENHRVGKEVNGVLQTGFLYDGDRILAQMNGSNTVLSQFIYATGATAPDFMVAGGVTYRIFSDQLGSPRLVVDTSTGAITEQINYDEFGNVINDTNPGFQPFGFAGGLYDQDTKFIRFGARDYDPAVGRWTAKDQILFAGEDTNLYGYAFNDPVNHLDSAGLDPENLPGWPIFQIDHLIEIAGGNGVAQMGATYGELVVMPLRTIDYTFGLGLLKGADPSLQDTTLWEVVQSGFDNDLYAKVWGELTTGHECPTPERDKRKHTYHTLSGDVTSILNSAANSMVQGISNIYGLR